MRTLYLILAILGAVVPYAFFIPFFAEHGIDLAGFVGALFANGAAGGFTADLLITSVVFWLFISSSWSTGGTLDFRLDDSDPTSTDQIYRQFMNETHFIGHLF